MTFVESSGVKVNDYFSRLEMDDEDGNEFTDRWNTGELLCLASAVQRSGDKNWVSVSRSIKPFGEPKRPPDWYAPKNCALQYSKLLKGVEDFKKKSLPRTERETSEELLIKNLTDKRLTELNWLNQQTKAVANSMKVTLEMLECGEFDDNIDELIKQIEEQEKKEEEDHKEWISKRETLNAAKRLNKCRVPLSKGKAPRNLDTKRKNSPNPDQVEDTTVHSTIPDIVIKTEPETDHEFPVSSKPVHVKTEIEIPSSISALLDGSKASTIIPPSPSSTAPTSPLLTSLLRSVASSSTGTPVVSYVSSPLKEIDSSAILDGKSMEFDMASLLGKSQETSPRGSLSQSPRPTPASSPLLNSLLKSSPSSSLTSIQLPPTKDVTSSKAASSPQSFFNPTSALATAAAQQLAVATSAVPQSHVFFPQQDSMESRKISLQSSPATSACLSAPTLSKLLEMPPSTPGRLPPLPVVEPVSSTAPLPPPVTIEQVVTQSPANSSTSMLLNELELELQIPSSSSSPKKSIGSNLEDLPAASDHVPSKKNSTAASSDKIFSPTINTTTVKTVVEQKIPGKRLNEIEDTSQENIDILEAVCESINQAFEKKEIKQEPHEDDNTQGKSKKVVVDVMNIKSPTDTDKSISDDLLNAAINIEKLISSDIGLDDKVFSEDITDTSSLNLFEDDKQKSSDIEIEAVPDLPASETVADADDADDDDKINGRKFYKSRTPTKKRPSTEEEAERTVESSPSKFAQKKQNKVPKIESEALPPIPVNEHILQAAKEAEEATMQKTPEKSSLKLTETKAPPAKKLRLFEKIGTKEKKELSEDETSTPKRPGRKAKKGRKVAKSTPVKQDEPKDQYEFSESTEENSVGYQTANTLCYMPRLKDDRFEEAKVKHQQPQHTEEPTVTSSSGSVAEKKQSGVSAVKSKHGKVPQVTSSSSSTRKALFTSDEERMSDSMTSDDASNSQLGDDKLKKWKELNEKKDSSKDLDEAVKISPKIVKDTDMQKKKLLQTKRNLFKSDTPAKEKKSVNSDVEESSVCSRDSEDTAGIASWQRDVSEAHAEKDQSPEGIDDVEMETNDTRMTTESDKQMDDAEGSDFLESTAAAELSPHPPEMKEEKDLSQFGKPEWSQSASPKSSEPVSQSSEESEYESDNWDNHSASTNKSATHAASHSTRTKRKERESPQFKAWKKAIGIVLREASCHKYANVFLQKVTNDVAPGYLSIVYRPMDLSLIKKNVDNGILKTTDEVHRDVLLMFQNAVMYNSSDHDVHHMAVEMQRDVIQQIQAFLTTQFNDKDESNELTSLRGARSAKSQKVYASSSKTKEETHEKE